MLLSSARANGIGIARILFGVVWLIDAQFKWRPAFINDMASFLSSAVAGQPSVVQEWINFWINVVNVNPVAFAYLVAFAETALAFALIFGFLSNLAYLGGSVLAFVIWSTAEGFGGPYVVGSTDIGAAVIYIFVFGLLYLTQAGLFIGVDGWLEKKLGSAAILASGRNPRDR